MKKTIIIIIVSLLPFLTIASEIKVSGHVVGAEGLQLRVFKYTDQISYQKEKLLSVNIDDKANFSFTINAEQAFYTFLSIDLFWSAPLYLEPGNSYYLDIDSADYKMKATEYFSFRNNKRIYFRVNHDHPKDLNNRIFNFNASYSEFVIKHFNSFGASSNNLIKEFKEECLSRYVNGEEDEYMTTYITYRIASLELSLNLKSEKTIFTTYISKQKVHWENDEYMAFFNQFYKKYFQFSSLLNERQIINSVNQDCNHIALLDSLGIDSTLRNEVIREMVFIKSLGEVYIPYSEYNPKNVLKLLSSIAKTTKFERHKVAALNMIKRITYLKKDTPAPDFTVKDIHDSLYSLNDFQGKWLYLGFWTSWSDPSIAEMEAMRKLHKDYQDSINFVMISVDQEFLDYYYFIKENSFPWPVLYYDKNIELIEAYHAKAFPLFFMIDPKGNIFKYPALKPSEGVENMFYYIKNRNKLPPDYSRVGKW
jgi:peroxiredoxin